MQFALKKIGLVGVLLVAPIIASQANAADSQSHSFGGLVAVEQKKESLSNLVMGLWGTISVKTDGSVSGYGVVRYEGVAPCSWTPPAPENGSAPYCKLENLFDGRFSVSGRVADEERTKFFLTELTEMVAGKDTKTAHEIIEDAPNVLEISISLDELPKEVIKIWGLSNGGQEMRETNVAAGGLLVSNLFNKDFLIALKSSGSSAPSRHEFKGSYEGDWPIVAAGAVYFPQIPQDKLPTETDHQVFVNGGVTPAGEELSESAIINLDVLNPWFGGLYDKK